MDTCSTFYQKMNLNENLIVCRTLCTCINKFVLHFFHLRAIKMGFTGESIVMALFTVRPEIYESWGFYRTTDLIIYRARICKVSIEY